MLNYAMAYSLFVDFLCADYLSYFTGFSFMSVCPMVWGGSEELFSCLFHSRYLAEKAAARFRSSGTRCPVSVIHIDDAWIVVPCAWSRCIRRLLCDGFCYAKSLALRKSSP